MKTNIFMKSILRQPVRTLFMAALIGVAAFAFVARAAEFVVVNREIRRAEGLFPSIGMLVPIDPQDFTTDHDVTRAAEIIAASPRLAFEDRRVFTQGVLYNRRNLASHFTVNLMVPHFEDVDIRVICQYFYGVVLNYPRVVRRGDGYFLMAFIEADGHVVGDPRALRYEARVFTNEQGQTVTIRNSEFFFLPLTDREAELFRQGLIYPSLTRGERYMFRGFRRYIGEGIAGYLRPLAGEDGLRYVERPVPGGMPGATFFELAIVEELRDEELLFFVDASCHTTVGATLASIWDELNVADMNLSSVTVVGTKDMTAIPRFTNPLNARLLENDGSRWLTHEDHVYANPVAVVPIILAVRSNLQVGESFTITLRNNPHPCWIDRETNSRWSRRIEGWWEHVYRGWWGLAYGDRVPDVETHQLTLEVVGVYMYHPPIGIMDNFSSNEIFIPASLIPEGFGWEGMPLLTGMYSFSLTSARYEAVFLRDHSAAIEALGFTVGFLPSDFYIFDAAIGPTRTSVAVNLAVFTVVSVLILALVIFLYLRQWSGALAIVRALGLPTREAMGRFFTPVYAIWVPALAVGAVVGWFFSLSQAEATLAEIGVIGETIDIDPGLGLFFALFAGIVFFAAAGIIVSGIRMAARPVLEQIQGTVQKVSRVKALPDSGPVPEFVKPTVGFLMRMPLETTPGAALRAGYRHIFRRIVRSPVKSLLAAVLALFFVISLGWMDHTIHFTAAEIERFMDTTVITANIVPSVDEGAGMGGTIGHVAVDAVMRSGFVQDAYLEAIWFWGSFMSHEGADAISTLFFGVNCLDGFVAENTRTPLDAQLGVLGDSMEIEFAPGATPEDFTFISGGPVPIVIRQSVMYGLGVAIGDTIILYNTAMAQPGGVWAPDFTERVAYGEIVGSFTGGLNRAIDAYGLNVSLVMPENFLRYKFLAHSIEALDSWAMGVITYNTARFYLDPARNRELYLLPDMVEGTLFENRRGRFFNPAPMELMVHDEIIRMVVEPMERNLALLQTLYPISIAVAIVLGFGLTLLIMLTGIKNAAIMRVLGMAKTRLSLSLWQEQVVVCAAGVVIGLVVLVAGGVNMGATPVVLAGMYFAAVALGAALGALAVCAKSPLELLQVKE